jgi:hypothetical protein
MIKSISHVLGLVSYYLKVTVRDKKSLLLIIAGPILLTFIISSSNSSNTLQSITVGVYTPEFGDSIDSFIETLENMTETKDGSDLIKELKVIKEYDLDDCKDDVKHNKISVCMVLPRDSDMNRTDAANTIVMYMDYSKLRLLTSLSTGLEKGTLFESRNIGEKSVSSIIGQLNTSLNVLLNFTDVFEHMKDNISDARGKIDDIIDDLNDDSFDYQEVNKSLFEDGLSIDASDIFGSAEDTVDDMKNLID